MRNKFEQLLKNAGVSGNSPIQSEQITDTIERANSQIETLTQATQTNVTSVTANTDALVDTSQSNPSLGERVAGSLGEAASSLLSSGGLLGSSSGGLSALFSGEGLLGGGLGALFSGISSLFSGGTQQPQPLTQYTPPEKQDLELADSNGTLRDAVDDSYGNPRTADFTELAMNGLQPSAQSSSAAKEESSSSATLPSNQGTNVTVHVQAMDSQSFMDRSGDIAQAVRQAMLNMHSINDVVNDL